MRGRRVLITVVTLLGLSTTVVGGAATASAHHGGAAAAVGSGAAHDGASKRWVMGYYAVYQRAMLPVSEIDWKAMTHLVVGAVVPRANGSLDTTFYNDPTHGPKIASQLAAAAKDHGVTPLLMVGGAGAHDDFAAAAKNHRETLVKNLLAVMDKEGFDGIDIDWEPVNHADQPALRGLVGALRKAAPNAILTMPVLWVSKTFPKVPKLYGALAKKLDRIDIMSYGMAGAYDGWKTWHSSALRGATNSTPSDVELNVKAFEKAGVPAAKLGVGIGFYGTCWSGGVDGPREPIGTSYVASDDNEMTFATIMSNYYNDRNYHYDKAAQAPYLSFDSPTGSHGCTFVSYEDERSVAAKGAYATAQGLGAEIIWTINQGHQTDVSASKADQLLDAVHQSFH
jgi:chitinase